MSLQSVCSSGSWSVFQEREVRMFETGNTTKFVNLFNHFWSAGLSPVPQSYKGGIHFSRSISLEPVGSSLALSDIRFLFFFFKILFIYLFFRERRREGKERERNISVWLPLMCPSLRTWPATQACALTGNWTGNSLVHRRALNPLSHTS